MCLDNCCIDKCCMDGYCMDKCCIDKWYWDTCQQQGWFYKLWYFPCGGKDGGWVCLDNIRKNNWTIFGNIWIIFEQTRWAIWAIHKHRFGKCLDYIPKTHNIFIIFLLYSGYIWAIFGSYSHNIWIIYRQYLDNVRTKQYLDDIQEILEQ